MDTFNVIVHICPRLIYLFTSQRCRAFWDGPIVESVIESHFEKKWNYCLAFRAFVISIEIFRSCRLLSFPLTRRCEHAQWGLPTRWFTGSFNIHWHYKCNTNIKFVNLFELKRSPFLTRSILVVWGAREFCRLFIFFLIRRRRWVTHFQNRHTHILSFIFDTMDMEFIFFRDLCWFYRFFIVFPSTQREWEWVRRLWFRVLPLANKWRNVVAVVVVVFVLVDYYFFTIYSLFIRSRASVSLVLGTSVFVLYWIPIHFGLVLSFRFYSICRRNVVERNLFETRNYLFIDMETIKENKRKKKRETKRFTVVGFTQFAWLLTNIVRLYGIVLIPDAADALRSDFDLVFFLFLGKKPMAVGLMDTMSAKMKVFILRWIVCDLPLLFFVFSLFRHLFSASRRMRDGRVWFYCMLNSLRSFFPHSSVLLLRLVAWCWVSTFGVGLIVSQHVGVASMSRTICTENVNEQFLCVRRHVG